MNRRVDIVIPVYRPDEKFLNLLRGLTRQEGAEIASVILMHTGDDFPEEKEAERILGGAGIPVTVRFLSPEAFDHGGTRAEGASLGSAPYFVCMTQDAVPQGADLLAALLRPFEKDDRVWVSYARQIPAPGCRFPERISRAFNYPDVSAVRTQADLKEKGIRTFFCSDVCACYRRDLYEASGGFVKKTIFNEDMLFAAKAVRSGGAVAYTADARVIHSHNLSGPELFRRNFDMGVSQAEHPEVFASVPSEGEGLRLVKKSIRVCLQSGRILQVPVVIWQSAWKYLGYRLGKSYKKLPKSLVRAFSQNKRYFDS